MGQAVGQALYVPLFCFLLFLSLHNLKNIFLWKVFNMCKNNSSVYAHYFIMFLLWNMLQLLIVRRGLPQAPQSKS